MRKTFAVLVFIVALLAFAPSSSRAQAKKLPPPPPKPAMQPAEEALANWNEIGRKIIAMADDFPEDKYNFKPAPEVRSFSGILLHVAAVNYFFTNLAAGKELSPAVDDAPADKYPSKAAIVSYVKKSFADGSSVIREKGEAGMAREVKHPFDNRMIRLSSLVTDFALHSSEHYGNLVTYYRLNKLVPPESRPRR